MINDQERSTGQVNESDRADVRAVAASELRAGLIELWSILWDGKWLIIGLTSVFAAVALTYVLLAESWYKAEVLVMPVQDKSGQRLLSQSGELGQLAALAGVGLGSRGNTAEPLAVLGSHDLTSAFIEEQQLLPVLFADKWDSKLGAWKSPGPRDQPDVRDAIKYFEGTVRRIEEDRKTGLVTLSVEWTNPTLAAQWANRLIDLANDRMRERARADAEANVNYLTTALGSSNVVTLQQSVGRLLEGELQTLMLAKGSKEFAFRVIDRATVPKWRSRPRRTMTVALAVMAGGMLSVLAVFARYAWRRDEDVLLTNREPRRRR